MLANTRILFGAAMVAHLAVQAFPSNMADIVEGIRLLVRPRLILVDLNMTNHPALFEMVIAPLMEGGDPVEFK